MKNKSRITVLSTDHDITFEDYVDFCEANDCNPDSIDSHDFFDYCCRTNNDYFEDELSCIRCSNELNIPVVLHGEVGLWHGRKKILPLRKDSVYDAICCIIRNFDGDIITAELNAGKICVQQHHHDGSNVFLIEALSARGLKKT